MNDSNMIIVFFGELSTKGKNIMNFIRLLGSNIKKSLKEYPELKYEIKKDHIYIHLNGIDYDKVALKLKKIPGILSFSLATRVDKDLKVIKELIKLSYYILMKSIDRLADIYLLKTKIAKLMFIILNFYSIL